MLVALLALVSLARGSEPSDLSVDDAMVPGTQVTDRIGYFDGDTAVVAGSGCLAQIVGTFREDASSASYDLSYTRGDTSTEAGVITKLGVEPITAKSSVFGRRVHAKSAAHYYGSLGEILIFRGSVTVDVTIDGVKQTQFILRPSSTDPGFCDFELITQKDKK